MLGMDWEMVRVGWRVPGGAGGCQEELQKAGGASLLEPDMFPALVPLGAVKEFLQGHNFGSSFVA